VTGFVAIIITEGIPVILNRCRWSTTGDWRDYFSGLGVVPPATNQDPGAAI